MNPDTCMNEFIFLIMLLDCIHILDVCWVVVLAVIDSSSSSYLRLRKIYSVEQSKKTSIKKINKLMAITTADINSNPKERQLNNNPNTEILFTTQTKYKYLRLYLLVVM